MNNNELDQSRSKTPYDEPDVTMVDGGDKEIGEDPDFDDVESDAADINDRDD
ncbi:hypothetical protein [Pseudomonas sp.]|jgi:hypothetical protein|uniref:hypothetical protein n=1 Tax=Pseudomonas sp. TaxID=306 RepID=UPI0028AFD092|nr:hypothetical protein [Pseudomonas sp.]